MEQRVRIMWNSKKNALEYDREHWLKLYDKK